MLKSKVYRLMAILRRRWRNFSSFFLLIHPCPDGEDDDQDDKDADKDSKYDKRYFSSTGSSRGICSFDGIGISDDFDIIIRTSIADDAIESEDLAHIRHDDVFHIQRIHLIRFDLRSGRGKAFGDEIDDILKHLFPFVLLRGVSLSAVRDDRFEFFEQSFYIHCEIRR